MDTITKPTKALARKIVSYLDEHGLTSGLGKPKPGQMCVEAMIRHVMGLPHGDEPPCVGRAVRDFKIRLNDCQWSSDLARAKGMRKLAVAQLGSNELNQMEFGKLVYLRGTQKLLPFVFRKVADDAKITAEQREKYLEHARKCEAVTSFEEARRATKDASDYASASAYASGYAPAPAYAPAYAYAYAPYAYAYAYAPYAYAPAYAWFKNNLGDDLLNATAEVGLSALIELKSPGCKWLDLCE